MPQHAKRNARHSQRRLVKERKAEEMRRQARMASAVRQHRQTPDPCEDTRRRFMAWVETEMIAHEHGLDPEVLREASPRSGGG